MDTPIIVRRHAPPDAWSEFTAWPGAASLVTLLSAACLLAGLWGVLAPDLGGEEQGAALWSVLATLGGYLGCLLGATWAMCRARAGSPDAIAVAVVGTALAIGYGAVLNLLAPGQPVGAAIAGGAGLLGLCSLWHGWQRLSGGRAIPAVAWPLLALAAWSCLWPLLLGADARALETAPRLPGVPASLGGMRDWTIGLLAVLGIAVWLLVGAVRGVRPDGDGPLLARPMLRWVLALVALGAAGLHLFVQGHGLGLDLCLGDFLPLAGLLVLLANELRARSGHAGTLRDACAAGAPIVLAVLVRLLDGGPAHAAERGDGWAPLLVAALSTPPAFSLWFGIVAGTLSLRRPAPGLTAGVVLALLAAVLTWDGPPRWAETALVGGALIGLYGAWRQRSGLLVGAAALFQAALPHCAGLDALLATRHLSAWSVSLLLAALAPLLAGLLRPALVGRGWTHLAAWWLLPACLDLFGRQASPLHAPLPAGAALALLLVALAWRRRDPLLALPLLPPALVALPHLLPERKAWLAVWSAFGLLGGAVWLAVRRRPEERIATL